MSKQQSRNPSAGPRLPVARRHVCVFIIAALACAAGLAAVYWFFVRTSTGQFLDESALDQAGSASARVSGPAEGFLDYLPAVSVAVAALMVFFVALVRRRWHSAGLAIGALLAANLTTELLKHVIFDRPDRGIETLDFNSLPSGHTSLAASSAAAVFLIVAPKWRPFAAAAGGAYSVAAGMSTLINGWHRPADVIAAFLVVSFWTLLGGLLILRGGGRWNVWAGYGRFWAASRFWPACCTVVGVLTGAASTVLVLTARSLGAVRMQGAGAGAAPDGAAGTVTALQGAPLYYWAGLSMIICVGSLLAALAIWIFGRTARVVRRRRH